MKKLQRPQISQKNNSIQHLKLRILAFALVILSMAKCTKDEPAPVPITKTVANPITITQNTLTSVKGDKGATKNIARYKGTALKGTTTSTYTKKNPDNPVYELKEHATFPKDSLTLTFKEKGSGKVIQKIISPDVPHQAEDYNGDGAIDDISYTSQTKTAESNVMVNLPEQTLENTITVTETPEESITGEIGETKFFKKFAGMAEQGDLNYSFELVGMSDVVEITETADGKNYQIEFKKAGTITFKQNLQSTDQTVPIDDDGDGAADRINNYTAETKEARTTVESTEVEFGIDEAGVAEVQEELNKKIIEMKNDEFIYIDFSKVLKAPSNVTSYAAYHPDISVRPFVDGLAENELVYEGNNLIGAKLKLKKVYRGKDLKVKLFTSYQGVEREILWTVPRGVSLDTSDPVQIRADIKQHFYDLFAKDEDGENLDFVEKVVDVDFKLYIRGGNSEHERLLKEETIPDRNKTLEQCGAVKSDGSPQRFEFVETQAESNIVLCFGDPNWLEAEYGVIINDGWNGVPLWYYKNNDRTTRNIVSGAAWVKITQGGVARDEVSIMMEELSSVIGFKGELDGSISSGGGGNILDTFYDKGALMMLYYGNVPADQRIQPGSVANVEPLLDNLLNKVVPVIIEEANNQ